MNFDFSQLRPTDRYKLLTGLVVPRPIAWVTTLNPDGSVNAAPFSFFNAMGSDPALLILSVGFHPERPKDTAANVRRSGHFVVNLVSAELAEQMSLTAAEFPPEVSEAEAVGLELEPSLHLPTPRIKHTPAALECKLHSFQEIGRNHLILGEILGIYVRDALVADPQKFHVKTAELNLVGRMGGRGGYVRTTDLFEIPRLTYAQWMEREGRGEREE
ncbi:MAG: flavin reductase family protein [Meiothermus sp.]|nr:flavin reductase family protein [Meiothermus sp.]